ncbi:uncharacterized protein C3orf84 homolog [Anolis carolinensis]|uniref:uncharacterized protein C3orf84 homolog n=1 Tax=Anolis carolinensis TaxID=28377 RepID=UPI000203AF38|nr:PREDICTED: uncharacterized protein C3orf84 homolog [Anolis carolinensis]|eukprot:XP_003228838.1 PREDICTED: uncharacterized protein C3orf84 homolog [Anolis carolinensis]
MPSPIVGTWHANGFYGNFRSKCRSDYTQEFRKAAQPPPPDVFLKRMKETPSKHIFSKIDNKHSFPLSATYFDCGLGRKRIDGSLPDTHTLMDWIPLKEELQRQRPLMSSYQFDFRSREKIPQILVHHTCMQAQPLLRTPSTTYQRTYRSHPLSEPSLGVVQQQDVTKETKTQATKSAASASSETTAPPSGKSAAAPTTGEPSTSASKEPTATEAKTVAEALVARSFHGRPMSSQRPKWTVSDCLHWHNC